MRQRTGAPARYEVEVEDIVYLRHGDVEMQARMFVPKGDGPFPAAVDLHGGAWVQGDRTGNDSINTRLAARGLVVMAVDYRLGPVNIHPAAVQDINYAIRWLKANSTRFQSNPERVGVIGTSAGGHLSLLTALQPLDSAHTALPMAGSLDAQVAFAVALWPVICPMRRYREVVLSGADNPTGRVAGTTRQMGYWLTQDAMLAGSPLELVLNKADIARPPTLIAQSPIDPLHPIAHVKAFIEGYRKIGGQIDLHLVGGEPYYRVRAEPDSIEGAQAIDVIARFVHNSQA